MLKKLLTTALLLIITLLYPFLASGEVVKWAQNGAAVSNSSAHKLFPAITGDGSGGAFVAWEDYSTDLGDIYVQRINVNGTPVLDSDKDVTIDDTAAKRFPAIIKDGSGGAFVVWEDDRNGTDTDIYIQKIDANGDPVWTTEDKVVCSAAGDQWAPQIALTTTGDVIVVWEDHRASASQIYAQRINKDTGERNPTWPADGIALSPASGNQFYPAISSDEQGGGVVVWEYQQYSTADSDIYAQRINSSGGRPWGDSGIAINSDDVDQWFPAIATDGTNFVITWEDYRIDGVYSDIYAKGINIDGSQIFLDTAVSSASSDQRFPRIAFSTNESSFVVVWEDYRNPTLSDQADIYAQKISISGNTLNTLWSANGEAVSVKANSQDAPSIISSDTRGVIATWEDFGSGNFYDIYALQLPIASSIVINSDAVNTDTNAVTLDIEALKIASNIAIAEMCISNETPTCIAWESYSTTKYLTTTTWLLDPIAGSNKTVYVQFKDTAGNLSPAYYDQINLNVSISDAIPPTSSITSPTSGSTISGTSYTIRGTASDTGSWVVKVEVSTDGGSTWSEAIGTTSWVYTWTIPANGSYAIKTRATDAAGNIETPGTGVTVIVDNAQPAPIGTLTISIEGMGQTYSYSEIIASWSPYPSRDRVTDYKIAIGSTSAFADVMPWTSIGDTTSYSTVNLQNAFESYKTNSSVEYFGKVFYLNIRAVNASGVESSVSSAPFVYTPADINSKSGQGDGRVDGFDLGKLGIEFGSSGQNLTADINRDGKVDGNDLIVLGTNFGKVKQ